jgi:hypothetical protein
MPATEIIREVTPLVEQCRHSEQAVQLYYFRPSKTYLFFKKNWETASGIEVFSSYVTYSDFFCEVLSPEINFRINLLFFRSHAKCAISKHAGLFKTAPIQKKKQRYPEAPKPLLTSTPSSVHSMSSTNRSILITRNASNGNHTGSNTIGLADDCDNHQSSYGSQSDHRQDSRCSTMHNNYGDGNQYNSYSQSRSNDDHPPSSDRSRSRSSREGHRQDRGRSRSRSILEGHRQEWSFHESPAEPWSFQESQHPRTSSAKQWSFPGVASRAVVVPGVAASANIAGQVVVVPGVASRAVVVPGVAASAKIAGQAVVAPGVASRAVVVPGVAASAKIASQAVVAPGVANRGRSRSRSIREDRRPSSGRSRSRQPSRGRSRSRSIREDRQPSSGRSRSRQPNRGRSRSRSNRAIHQRSHNFGSRISREDHFRTPVRHDNWRPRSEGGSADRSSHDVQVCHRAAQIAGQIHLRDCRQPRNLQTETLSGTPSASLGNGLQRFGSFFVIFFSNGSRTLNCLY